MSDFEKISQVIINLKSLKLIKFSDTLNVSCASEGWSLMIKLRFFSLTQKDVVRGWTIINAFIDAFKKEKERLECSLSDDYRVIRVKVAADL